MISMTLLLIRNGFGTYEDVMRLPFRMLKKYYISLTKNLREERKNEIETQINILKNFRCPLYTQKNKK